MVVSGAVMTTVAHIPAVEVEPHPLSYADPNGRLFSWRGELYRGVYPGRTAFYEQLFSSGVAPTLIDKGLLIDAAPTALAADGFGLVLRCRRLPFVSYPFEWSAEMLRSAALLVLDLERELLNHALTLQDGQSWNVLYEATRPVYVDWGSIVPFSGGPWTGEADFRAFFLYPLQFMEAGHHRLARRLMHDIERGIQPAEAELLSRRPPQSSRLRRSIDAATAAVRRSAPEGLRRNLRRVRQSLGDSAVRQEVTASASIDRLYEEVSSIALSGAPSAWQGYYATEFPSFSPGADWTPKHHAVDALLTECAPATVLDVGSNSGWFAQLASRKGAQVVAFDSDEGCVDELYRAARSDRQPILPLVMSFANPTPGYGVNNGFSSAATERFQCDLVLALAITHHLVFRVGLRFDQMAAGLAALTRRTLAVEFVPRDDEYVRRWDSARHDWYEQQNFIASLSRYFSRITVRPSHPAPRTLIVCER
jgi:hypothetical protein